MGDRTALHDTRRGRHRWATGSAAINCSLLLDFDGAIVDVMHRRPKAVRPDQLVAEAGRIMRDNKIDQVPVVDEQGVAIGFLDVQDLLATRTI